MKKLLVFICIAAIAAIVSIFSTAIVKSIQFNQNCGGYLDRAASANTVELARQELKIALDYIEQNNLTKGYTSALWRTPDEDLGFWYSNIKTAYTELCNLPANSSSLEKSNMLIKLRETLTDQGEKGTHLTIPLGITRYPNNLLWGVALWACTLLILFFVFGVVSVFED